MSGKDIETLQRGDQLYGYRIEKVLGQGGFGITYLGVSKETGEKVVIKENIPGTHAIRRRGEKAFTWEEGAPKTGTGSAEWARENFIREARNLARLNHPGVVRVINAYESDDTRTQYYVMPYVESVSLEQALSRGLRPTHDWAHYMLCSLLHALQHVHHAGLLHRDIKPGNILVKADGSPVLIDFGSARAMAKDGKTRIVSEEYSPIEQMRGAGEGPWTDLYALGATFYRILTGNFAASLMQRMENPQAYVPLVSDQQLVSRYGYPLLSSIDHALAFEPEDRFQSAEEWLKNMNNVPGFQNEEPVPLLLVAPRGNGTGNSTLLDDESEPQKRKKKKAWLWWLLGVLLLLLLAAIIAALLLPKEEPPISLPPTGPIRKPKTETTPQPEAQKRVIIRPNAKLYTVDGASVAPSEEQPAPFSVFYILKDSGESYIVARRPGEKEEPVGSLRKSEVYVWDTNLTMRFNVSRSELGQHTGAMTSDNRALYFDTPEHLQEYVQMQPSRRKEIVAQVEQAIARARGGAVDLGELRQQHGIIGVEPTRRGSYMLPLLEVRDGMVTYGAEDANTGGLPRRIRRVQTSTTLVKVAAMNAPQDPQRTDTTVVEQKQFAPVDIIFVVDTTRSMKPYIDGARSFMETVVSQIKEHTEADLLGKDQVKFNVVGYRDWKAMNKKGTGVDESFNEKVLGPVVTLYSDHPQTAGEFLETLRNVDVSEGDSIDYHEDVFAGLWTAVWNAPSSVDENGQPALKRIILIGDAPGRGISESPLLKDGREVSSLSLGSPYWAYRPQGSMISKDYAELAEKLKDVVVTAVYTYTEPPDFMRGNRKFLGAFDTYEEEGLKQFAFLSRDPSLRPINLRELKDTRAFAGFLAKHISSDVQELAKMVVTLVSDRDSQVMIQFAHTAVNTLVQQLNVEGLSSPDKVREFMEQVVSALQNSEQWGKFSAEEKRRTTEELAQGVVDELRRRSDMPAISEETYESIRTIMINTLSKSAYELSLERGVGLDRIIAENKKTHEERMRELAQQNADGIHDIFTEAYVNWDAGLQTGKNELMDTTAWMPDHVEPRRESLQACVVLTRKQLAAIVQRMEALQRQVTEEGGNYGVDVFESTAAVICDVLEDPALKKAQDSMSDQGGRDKLMERIRNYPYKSNLLKRLEIGELQSASNRGEEFGKMLSNFRLYQGLPDSAWFKDPSAQNGGRDNDYILVPVDDLP